jgi:hypothetical protein
MTPQQKSARSLAADSASRVDEAEICVFPVNPAKAGMQGRGSGRYGLRDRPKFWVPTSVGMTLPWFVGMNPSWTVTQR